ncbi:MAG: bifunctional diguanylate cyclase/phosphodiesterase [Hyphomicrobiales bacterium]|nr:bifunctional diguanylate cyclase/phosphodiesterase [Hyphomicrobiales bacterium]
MGGRSMVRLLDFAVAGLFVLALTILGLFTWAARVADRNAFAIETQIVGRELGRAVEQFRNDLPNGLVDRARWQGVARETRLVMADTARESPPVGTGRFAGLLADPATRARIDELRAAFARVEPGRGHVEFIRLGPPGGETLALVARIGRPGEHPALAFELVDLPAMAAALETLSIELFPVTGPYAEPEAANGRLELAGLGGEIVGRLFWRGQRLAAIASRQILPALVAILCAASVILFLMRRRWRNARETFERDLERVEQMAGTDTLTGLPNRRALFRHLAAVAPPAQTYPPITVMMLDLDGFKWVNDTLGHEAGDRLLVQAAAVFRAELGPETFLARLGGDEFVAVVPGEIVGGALTRLHAHLSETLRRRVPSSLAGMPVGVSIGAVSSVAEGGSGEHLLSLADIAVYAAKAAGRGAAVSYDGSMEVEKAFRRSLERDLRAAVLTRELRVHHQPIVEALSGKVVGYESLVRWQHPFRGLLMPSEFIPLAEDTDLIVEIGNAVLNQALEELGPVGDCRISVNTTGRQLISPGFVDHVKALLVRHGVAPRRLCLELTETSLITDGARVGAVLTALRAHGVRIAIDDFGTGYSSLSYLMRFTFDTLKLDRTFIAALDDKPESPTIVTSITALARSLGMEIVGEGVETVQQQIFLAAAGVTYLQGYLFGRPVPLDRLVRGTAPLVPAAETATLGKTQRAA